MGRRALVLGCPLVLLAGSNFGPQPKDVVSKIPRRTPSWSVRRGAFLPVLQGSGLQAALRSARAGPRSTLRHHERPSPCASAAGAQAHPGSRARDPTGAGASVPGVRGDGRRGGVLGLAQLAARIRSRVRDRPAAGRRRLEGSALREATSFRPALSTCSLSSAVTFDSPSVRSESNPTTADRFAMTSA